MPPAAAAAPRHGAPAPPAAPVPAAWPWCGGWPRRSSPADRARSCAPRREFLGCRDRDQSIERLAGVLAIDGARRPQHAVLDRAGLSGDEERRPGIQQHDVARWTALAV